MAAIVSAADYVTWRTGSTAVLTSAQFPFYETKAEAELGRQTFGLLASVVIVGTAATIVIDDETITLTLANIKNCICEIAEFLYQHEQRTSGGIMTSFSNDGQSASFDTTALTENGKMNFIRSIAQRYLSGTVLTARGVTNLWH